MVLNLSCNITIKPIVTDQRLACQIKIFRAGRQITDLLQSINKITFAALLII